MNFVIRGNNIDVTDALRNYIEKKLQRLEKYFDTPPSADVHVSLAVRKDGHQIEVTIPFPGVLVRAEEQSEDMYASVDLVLEKLERQIRKYKTRVNRKFRNDDSLHAAIENALSQDDTDDDDRLEIVRTKRFDLKPMDTEEAVLQMDMLGHNFFVFTNAITDQVNVVYKRKDGRYGLIEPE